jgi:type II secretory pathway predicted ATPase ExeA
MYTEFYHLNSYPFENTPDPRFLFPSKKHREVLASLIYGVENSKGFIVLVGDIGTGKTTLIHTLIKEMNPSYLIFNSINPELRVAEIIEYMTKKLGITSNNKGPFEVLEVFKEKLKILSKKEIKVVLIIDEAHLLTESSLQKIRLLSNLESAKTKLIQIILVGQNELYLKLRKKSLKTLSQRIIINRYLEPLSNKEVKKYIEHRLRVAGRRSPIFSKKAISLISKCSKGFPRLINHICDNALLIGYALTSSSIDHRIIKEVVNDMNFKKNFKRVSFLMKPSRLIWFCAAIMTIIVIFLFTNKFLPDYDFLIKNVKVNENNKKPEPDDLVIEKSSKIKTKMNHTINKSEFKSKSDQQIVKASTKSQDSNLISKGFSIYRDHVKRNEIKNVGRKINTTSEFQIKKVSRSDLGDPIEPESKYRPNKVLPLLRSYKKNVHIGPFSDSSGTYPSNAETFNSKKEKERSLIFQIDKKAINNEFSSVKFSDLKKETELLVKKSLFSIKTVKPSESLSVIVHNFYGVSIGLALDFVQTANPEIYDINKIFPGQKIILPHIEKKHLVVKDRKGRYLIHYASFYNLKEAQQSCNRSKNNNDIVSVISTKHLQGENLVYRIYLGFFNSSDEAEKRLVDLKPKYLSFIIRKTGGFVWNREE